MERGKIRNRDLALKERDFSGLRWGKITPTDIDGFVEFGNTLFVFVEGKFGQSAMPYGQRLALERLCDACHNESSKKYSIAFVVSHDGADVFDYARGPVLQYRWRGQWIEPNAPINLKTAIDRMHKRYVGNVVEFKGHAARVAEAA
jgi:hypothetical protein